MRTYYVIRCGWNRANQSSMGRPANPRDQFDSNHYRLVAIVEADSEEAAIESANVTVWNNQSVFATANVRSVKGLAREARQFAQRA
jgi:hypothetical protein